MCFVGELQAPSPAPPGLAPPSRGAGSGPAAGLRAPARRLSPPAGALPASLPRRRARVRPCPRPRLAARRKQLETRQKVAAEEVQRGSGRAAGRRAATSDGRAARHSAAGRVERGGGGGGKAKQPKRRRGAAAASRRRPTSVPGPPQGAGGQGEGAAEQEAGDARGRVHRGGPGPTRGAGARAAQQPAERRTAQQPPSKAGAGQAAAPRLRASPRPLSAAPRPAARAFAQPQSRKRQWRPRSRLAAKQRHQEAAGV